MTRVRAWIWGLLAGVEPQRLLWVVVILGCLGSATASGTRLEVAEFALLPGDRVEIDLVFSEAPPPPSDFATEHPARIAIDFPGVSSQLGRMPLPIDLGVARSLVAIEAADRTRVVINLDASVPYRIDRQGKRVRVALNPERAAPRARALEATEPASSGTAVPGTARRVPERVVDTGDRLSLNFQDIEVRAVLQLLADFTGLNLVASDSVSGRITLSLRNVPWDQALEIILQTKGLSMRQAGNIIMVAPSEELAAREVLKLERRQQLHALVPLRTELIQIHYAKAEEVVELLKGHRENIAERTGSDTRDNVQLLADERPAPVLSRRGTVSFDRRTNTIVIQDTAERIAAIRALIARLDIPVRQVLIESRVVIANNNFARDLGVRFGASGSTGALGRNELLVGGGALNDGAGLGPYGFFNTGPFGEDGQGERFNSTLTGGTGNPLRNDAGAPNLWVNLPVQNPSGAINFLLGKVGSHLITLELSAMQREGRGEIISSPRVVTADQTSAIIEVGQDIPVVTPATAESPATVRYEPATLKLNVTPHITPDNRVIMALEVNKDEADFTFTVDGNPLRNRRAVSTSVLVDNGETIVLGGVFEGQKNVNVEKVPWLGDLPVLGRLFKTTLRQESNQELLIFVTPKILASDLVIR